MTESAPIAAVFQRDSPASPDPEPPRIIRGVGIGRYNEDWIRDWQEEMLDCYRQVMTRLVTNYYGIWPSDDAPEWITYQAAAKQFSLCKIGIRKRIALAKHLFGQIERTNVLDPEGAGLLSKLNLYLAGRILSFRNKYELFKNFNQVEMRGNEEVSAFLDDLKTHSEAFKNAAYEELLDNVVGDVEDVEISEGGDSGGGYDDDYDADVVMSDEDVGAVGGQRAVRQDDAGGSAKAAGKDDAGGSKKGTGEDDAGGSKKVSGEDDAGAGGEHRSIGKDDAGGKKKGTGKDDAGESKKTRGKDDAGGKKKDNRKDGSRGDEDVMTDEDEAGAVGGQIEVRKVGGGSEKDDAGGDDKKDPKDDANEYDDKMTERDDSSYGIDRIDTDSTDDKTEAEKDDTSDEMDKIMTDKDDSSNDDKKDDAGGDQAEGKKDDDAGKDGKMVTKQDDSEDGWC